MGGTAKKIYIISYFSIISAFFYLFTFNSGYGYDALEYLVIGRSLLNGYPFYAFIPSKSWGIYYLVYFYLSLGNVANHYGISLLITLIFVSTLLVTFFIVKRKYNYRVAFLSSFLVGICGVFMELNFLEPEGLVYILGMLAFYFISKSVDRQHNSKLFIGGLLLGFGVSFKAVAGFYWLASAVFIFLWGYYKENEKTSGIIKKELILLSGFIIAVMIPTFYFLSLGKYSEHLEWTYLFPLFKYPQRLEGFHKLSIKIMWFFVLFPVIMAFSCKKTLRRKIYSNPDSLFILFLGLISLFSMFKTLAPHYVYPGATFLSIFVSAVLNEEINNRGVLSRDRILGLSVLIILLLCVISGYLYRPKAIRRFISINDYSREADLKRLINKYAPANKKVLFLGDPEFLYWISGKYPNIPFVHFSVQFTYVLKNRPDLLLNALNDPDLYLVEFNPYALGIEDMKFFKERKNLETIESFFENLRKHFVISDKNIAPYIFWTKRDLLNN